MKVLYVFLIIFSDPEGAAVVPERFSNLEACKASFNAAIESGFDGVWGRGLIGIGSRGICVPVFGEDAKHLKK